RFVAAGDCRSHPERWALVAAAIEKAQPSLLVFNGDLVYDGRNDELWDSGFFTPASSLMKHVPFYPAPGNHEFEAPAYLKLFYTPADREENANWAQAVGPVLLIGIEGAQVWTEGSPNYKWMEGVLAASKEKFIFLANHYPAWSSGAHGKGNERPMLQMRNSIMPLLAKYHATALLAGHDHNYERNEPPAEIGVTSITTGGAGAPGRGKSAAGAAGNPYSKVFAAVLHYCLFEVDGDKCVMKVYDLDGKVIDEKTFVARKP
ncbi:MAG: metallophosphoesterase, partial [Planctomycetia bacterium]|nr:metallophosphoesterase [Planctomycetia bacterium]